MYHFISASQIMEWRLLEVPTYQDMQLLSWLSQVKWKPGLTLSWWGTSCARPFRIDCSNCPGSPSLLLTVWALHKHAICGYRLRSKLVPLFHIPTLVLGTLNSTLAKNTLTQQNCQIQGDVPPLGSWVSLWYVGFNELDWKNNQLLLEWLPSKALHKN